MWFKEFLQLTEFAVNMYPDAPLGAVISSPAFGATPMDANKGDMRDPAPITPGRGDFTLNLPQVTKTGTIRFIDDKRNPLLVVLDSGAGESTTLMIPPDAFRRIQSEPAVGKMMTVVMQRRPDDTTRTPSKIIGYYCS